MPQNLFIGKAGELRVASELLLRGFDVHLSLVDSGSDLILQNGIRIQVKTAHKTVHTTSGYKAYVFTFKKWKKRKEQFEAHALKDVDFIILWGIDDDLFIILPAEEIRGKFSVRVGNGERGWSKYLSYKDKWDILNEKR